jgi:hypothetical protein
MEVTESTAARVDVQFRRRPWVSLHSPMRRSLAAGNRQLTTVSCPLATHHSPLPTIVNITLNPVRLFGRPVPWRSLMAPLSRCHIRSANDETTYGPQCPAWNARPTARSLGLNETFRAKFKHPYTGVLWQQWEAKAPIAQSFERPTVPALIMFPGRRDKAKGTPAVVQCPKGERRHQGRAGPASIRRSRIQVLAPRCLGNRTTFGVTAASRNAQETCFLYHKSVRQDLAREHGPNSGVD